MNLYSNRRLFTTSNLNTLVAYASQRGPVNLKPTHSTFKMSRLPLQLVGWNFNLFAYLPSLQLINYLSLHYNGCKLVNTNFLFRNTCPESNSILYKATNHPGLQVLIKSLRYTPLRTAMHKVSKQKPVKPNYSIHPTFINYSHLFDKSTFSLFTPFIQASIENFNVYKPKIIVPTVDINNWEFNNSLLRRSAFLMIIAGLTKKIKITSAKYNYLNLLKKSFSFKETFNPVQQRQFFLIPRQLTFLNNSQPTSFLGGFNFSFKVLLLDHFYEGYSQIFNSRDSFQKNPIRFTMDAKLRLVSLASSFVDRYFLTEFFTKTHLRRFQLTVKSFWLHDEDFSKYIRTQTRVRQANEAMNVSKSPWLLISPKARKLGKLLFNYKTYRRQEFLLESVRSRFPIYRAKTGVRNKINIKYIKHLARYYSNSRKEVSLDSKHIGIPKSKILSHKYTSQLKKLFMLFSTQFPKKDTSRPAFFEEQVFNTQLVTYNWWVGPDSALIADFISFLKQNVSKPAQLTAFVADKKFLEKYAIQDAKRAAIAAANAPRPKNVLFSKPLRTKTVAPVIEVAVEPKKTTIDWVGSELDSDEVWLTSFSKLLLKQVRRSYKNTKNIWLSNIRKKLSDKTKPDCITSKVRLHLQQPKKESPIRRKVFRRYRRRTKRHVRKQVRLLSQHLALLKSRRFKKIFITTGLNLLPIAHPVRLSSRSYVGSKPMEELLKGSNNANRHAWRGAEYRINKRSTRRFYFMIARCSYTIIRPMRVRPYLHARSPRSHIIKSRSFRFPEYKPNILTVKKTLRPQYINNISYNPLVSTSPAGVARSLFLSKLQPSVSITPDFIRNARLNHFNNQITTNLIGTFASQLNDVLSYRRYVYGISDKEDIVCLTNRGLSYHIQLFRKEQKLLKRYYSCRRTNNSRVISPRNRKFLGRRSRRVNSWWEKMGVYVWKFTIKNLFKTLPTVTSLLRGATNNTLTTQSLITTLGVREIQFSYSNYFHTSFSYFPYQNKIMFSRLWQSTDYSIINPFFSEVLQPQLSIFALGSCIKRTFKNLFTSFMLTPVLVRQEGAQYEVFKRNFIASRYELPFTLSNVGFLFLSCDTLPWHIDYSLNKGLMKARIHTHRLSFFYKNDIKRVYLRRPGLLKLLTSFSEEDSLTTVDSFLNLTWKTSTNNLRSDLHSFNQARLISAYFNPSVDPYRANEKLNLYKEDEYLEKEPMIRRVRFKPGYQRVWRRAREAINYTLNYHCRYQVGLTKRLMRVRRLKRADAMKMQELTLQKMLLNAHFVFDMPSSLLLVQSNTVYVNGTISVNPNLKLFTNDFIQLIITLRYYIVYRWLVNWNSYHNLRFMKLTNFKNNASRYDLSKQISSHLPDWIFTIGYRALDIPKYLEVDYFTLSAFLIYEPLNISEYNPLNYLDTRSEIYSMYNWKFIN